MLVVFFILLSILFTILSLLFCRRILNFIKSTPEQPFLDSWFILSFIIVVVLIGLFFYLILIVKAQTYNVTRHTLVSALILVLSLFTLIILNLSFKLTHEMHKINQSLAKREKQLEKNKVLLEEKNIELNKTLEDFYTYRLKMAGQLSQTEKTKIKKENNKLAKKLKIN